jgi:hypothetical protein
MPLISTDLFCHRAAQNAEDNQLLSDAWMDTLTELSAENVDGMEGLGIWRQVDIVL